MTDSRIKTPEHADKLDRLVGAIPIGPYIRGYTKRQYQCTQCNDLYLNTHKDIQRRHITTCPKCSTKRRTAQRRYSIEQVKLICIQNGFEPLFDNYVNMDSKIRVRCRCGKICYTRFSSIKFRKKYSCGHCNDPNIGDRFGQLTIINTKPSTSIGCSVQCKCDCGNILKWTNAYNIIGGNIKTCGYCNNTKIGDKYGELEVIEVILGSAGKGCKAKCKCSCGNIIILKHSKLKAKNNTSCGHCNLKRNNKFTSHTALRLHNIIEEITQKKWEHNYHIKSIGCIDIVNTEQKIAIEYDGYYNHMIRAGDRSKKDKDKINKLIKNGWKVLHIKSAGRDLPTKKQLFKILTNDFQHGSKKKTITMKSWKKMEQKYENQ